MITIPSFDTLLLLVTVSMSIICITQLLKKKGIFTEQDLPAFEKFITEIALPVLIFSVLLDYEYITDILLPAGILFLALICSFCLAYGVCLLLRLSPKVTGSVVMVSVFGSTATLGYPLIIDMFYDVDWGGVSVFTELGLTIGDIGVLIPFLILGPIIASYFGKEELGKETSILVTLRGFFITPIFLSFVLGVFASVILTNLNIPGEEIFSDFFDSFFSLITYSLDLFIWIVIGLMIRPIKLSYILPLFVFVVILKMFVQPLLVVFGAGMTDMTQELHDVLLLLSAMPSGALAAIFASRYGCDGSLAGWMVIGTYLISLVTIPLFFFLI